MVLLPNFLYSTFLHVVGLPVRALKFIFVVRAHLATWFGVQIWTTLPLLIEFAKVLRVAGVGRVFIALTLGATYAGMILSGISLFSERLIFLWDYLSQFLG